MPWYLDAGFSRYAVYRLYIVIMDLHHNLHVKKSDHGISQDTVDSWNPAKQLRLVVYPIIYRVLYIHPVVGLGISEPSMLYVSFEKTHRDLKHQQ